MELKIRGNQLITTFGPGSIVDFPNLSIMPSSVNFWARKNSKKIDEPRLSRILRVLSFYSPPHKFTLTGRSQNDIPFQFFPNFVVCPSCQRIGYLEYMSASINRYRRGLSCRRCRSNLYPARFIMACENGHIDDFPWSYWVHRGEQDCPGYKLKIYNRGSSSGLDDVIINCLDCKKQRSLAGALAPDALFGLTCTSRKPWLEDDLPKLKPWFDVENELQNISSEEETSKDICRITPRVLQRGASNVYFSLLESALSIPDASSPLESHIRRSSALSNPTITSWLNAGNDGMVKEFIKGLRESAPEFEEYDVEQIFSALKEKDKKESHPDSYKSPRELKNAVRGQEWHVLTTWAKIDCTTDSPQVEFTKEVSETPEDIQDYIDQITRVKRLREVRVLYGFKRITPDIDSDDNSSGYVDFREETEKKWLPAVEVKGEGIFIRFNANQVRKWRRMYETDANYLILQEYLEDQIQSSNIFTPFNITPQFILAHSFAHGIIRQLSLACGYSSSSLRERIYSLDDNNVGFLIYTSSSDSEGSLGGLVRQGEKESFSNIVTKTINDASWCSSDPLCGEPSKHSISKLNIAACHACLLISETSCENRNRYLDRRVIAGTPENFDLGFFSGLV